MARTSLVVSTAACFAALSALLAVAPLSFSFPVLTYLKYDLAEIPSLVALLLIGPTAAFAAATAHWLALNAVGSFVPWGPLFKYSAVLSTIAGFIAGAKLAGRGSVKRALAAGLVLACVVRVAAMSVANVAFFLFVEPGFLGWARGLLAAAGLASSTESEVLAYVLALTAVFNATHVALSLLPAYAALKAALSFIKSTAIGEPWIDRLRRSSR